MKTKISVAMATYNGSLYIEEQLNSIINQTILPDEIIISDNYSTDDTVKKCERILSKTNKIKYKIIYEKNRNVLANFQNAINTTTGDIIFLCDQDDVWFENKIEKFLNIFLSNSNCCCVFSNSYLDNEKKEKMISKLLENEDFKLSEGYLNKDDFFNIEIKKNIVTGMSLAISDKLKYVSFPLSKYVYHDYWFAINAIFTGDVYYIDEPTAYYRQHEGNVVGTKKRLTLNKIYRSIKKTKEKCENELKFLIEIENKYPFAINYSFFKNKISFLKKRLDLINNPSIKTFFCIYRNKSYSTFYNRSSEKYRDCLFVIFDFLFRGGN